MSCRRSRATCRVRALLPVRCGSSTLTSIKMTIESCRMVGDKERAMRFYFDMSDRLPIRDEVGRDFKLVSEAVVYSKYLAGDLRCVEHDIRPQLSIQVIGEGYEQIHEEAVFS